MKTHRRLVRKLPLQKKLIFSAISVVLFFAILEGVLGLVGLTPVTVTDDPFVGFADRIPLLEVSTNENGEQIVSTASNKLHWFNAQIFPLKKTPETRRVFCLGGSTTYGHPYWDSTSYSRWLREFLPLTDSAHQWEVINLGGISYASYRVAAVMEELAQYDPDLFIVYSAHNEFLERRTYAAMFDRSPIFSKVQSVLVRTRIWALMHRVINFNSPSSGSHDGQKRMIVDLLPAEVDELLNHTSGPVDYHRDDAWQANVLRHYETNLRRMVSIAEGCAAKIVFVTPASNEKNCSPFKSELASTLDADDRTRFDALLRKAEELSAASNLEAALAILEEARGIDSHHAELLYRIGRLQFDLGRYAEAQQTYLQALNEDVCPLRAVSGITSAIRRVATETDVPVVDFEQRLRAKCQVEQGHSILGEEYFLDHVHPTIDIHRQLALWIIEGLQQHGLIEGIDPMDRSLEVGMMQITEKVLAQIDKPAQGIALRNLAKVLHWAGKFEEAAPRARDALESIPNDPESRYVLADCLKNLGRYDAAIAEYELLFQGQVEFDRAYHRFGEVLALRGHFLAAKTYLMLGVLREPQNAHVHRTLGEVHLKLGELQFAIESLTEANRLSPNDARTLELLAQAKTAGSSLEIKL